MKALGGPVLGTGGLLAVHFGRYVAQIEEPNGSVVNRAATLTWIAENRDPNGGGPPSLRDGRLFFVKAHRLVRTHETSELRSAPPATSGRRSESPTEAECLQVAANAKGAKFLEAIPAPKPRRLSGAREILGTCVSTAIFSHRFPSSGRLGAQSRTSSQCSRPSWSPTTMSLVSGAMIAITGASSSSRAISTRLPTSHSRIVLSDEPDASRPSDNRHKA